MKATVSNVNVLLMQIRLRDTVIKCYEDKVAAAGVAAKDGGEQ